MRRYQGASPGRTVRLLPKSQSPMPPVPPTPQAALCQLPLGPALWLRITGLVGTGTGQPLNTVCHLQGFPAPCTQLLFIQYSEAPSDLAGIVDPSASGDWVLPCSFCSSADRMASPNRETGLIPAIRDTGFPTPLAVRYGTNVQRG